MESTFNTKPQFLGDSVQHIVMPFNYNANSVNYTRSICTSQAITTGLVHKPQILLFLLLQGIECKYVNMSYIESKRWVQGTNIYPVPKSKIAEINKYCKSNTFVNKNNLLLTLKLKTNSLKISEHMRLLDTVSIKLFCSIE